MICNIFIRNIIFTTLGLFFFGFGFFSNLEMIFTKENILSQLWIPNIVWWLMPLTYFILFGLFLILQIRCIYNKKWAKKNLRILHLFVSFFYGFFSLILLFLILFGLDWLFPILTIFIAFWLRNYYIYYRIKTKTYLWNFDTKDFLYSYTIYMLIISFALIVFTRWVIPNISLNNQLIAAKNYHAQQKLIDLVQKPIIDEYLESIAQKQDPYADYEVIIYNLNDGYLQQIEDIFEQTKHIDFNNKNIHYNYNNLLLAQKINILKFQYHILKNQDEKAQDTLTHIFKINDALLKNCTNYIDIKAYLKIQNLSLDIYQKYKYLFTQEQITQINTNISDLNLSILWGNLLSNELLFTINQYDYLYNIPLIINKSEMKNLEYSYFIQKLEHPHKIIKRQTAQIHRSNYFWLLITQMQNFPSALGYKNLEWLQAKITETKK